MKIVHNHNLLKTYRILNQDTENASEYLIDTKTSKNIFRASKVNLVINGHEAQIDIQDATKLKLDVGQIITGIPL